MKLKMPFFLMSLILGIHFSHSQNIYDISDSTVKVSFRGLSVVNDSVVWVSGAKGTVGLSINKGKKWKWIKVKDKLDFRSIYAFDEKCAVIANAGFPATILRTENGGDTWEEVYSSKDSALFFDGIDFWDAKHGIIFGDPVNGKLFLSVTKDGGKTWKEIPAEKRPQLETGEASFAASGTTIRTFPNGKIIIASGGKVSRLWYSADYGFTWKFFPTPILQGKASTGIFSFAVSKNKIIIAGGDYSIDTLKTKNIFTGIFPGKKFESPKISTRGYMSCVEFISDSLVLATGTIGTDASFDSGNSWTKINGTSYNTVRKARKGKEVFFCGGNGKLGRLIPK